MHAYHIVDVNLFNASQRIPAGDVMKVTRTEGVEVIGLPLSLSVFGP